jgi:hypothetical protein
MKYKVGDVVKLRDDLEVVKTYGGIAYTGDMEYLKKQPSTIETCIEDSWPNRYKTKERWTITDEMIEGLWEECKGISYETYKEKTNKYKLIDILNKIANGELKEGTKVKLLSLDNEYILSEYRGLVDEYGKDVFETYNFYVLNTPVELIEPDHFPDVGKMAEHFREDTKMIEPTDNTKLEELDVNALTWNDLLDYQKLEILFYKLNEVIRYINK